MARGVYPVFFSPMFCLFLFCAAAVSFTLVVERNELFSLKTSCRKRQRHVRGAKPDRTAGTGPDTHTHTRVIKGMNRGVPGLVKMVVALSTSFKPWMPNQLTKLLPRGAGAFRKILKAN